MFYKKTGIFCEANKHFSVKYPEESDDRFLLRQPLLVICKPGNDVFNTFNARKYIKVIVFLKNHQL